MFCRVEASDVHSRFEVGRLFPGVHILDEDCLKSLGIEHIQHRPLFRSFFSLAYGMFISSMTETYVEDPIHLYDELAIIMYEATSELESPRPTKLAHVPYNLGRSARC